MSSFYRARNHLATVTILAAVTLWLATSTSWAQPGARLDGIHDTVSRVSAIRFTFGNGITHSASGVDYVASAQAGPRARVIVASGGQVEPLRRVKDNRAVGFPNACDGTGACPRALLSVPDGDLADPGTRQFSYGATIWMHSATDGQNVIQKGLQKREDPMDQWKLQVDGDRAAPSCVVADASGGGLTVYAVYAKRSLLDQGWVRVRCDRTATRLVLTMRFPTGETYTASTAIPANLAIGNGAPLLIGSNGTLPGDDQFVGRLDGAFFKIG